MISKSILQLCLVDKETCFYWISCILIQRNEFSWSVLLHLRLKPSSTGSWRQGYTNLRRRFHGRHNIKNTILVFKVVTCLHMYTVFRAWWWRFGLVTENLLQDYHQRRHHALYILYIWRHIITLNMTIFVCL